MTLTTHAPHGLSVSTPRRRPRPDRPRVTAVLVSHDGARWLPRTLAALAAQTRPADTVIAVDTGSDDGSPGLLRADPGVGQVHVVGRRTGFGAAVRTGLEHAGPDPATNADWVWLLHDDSAPQPQALAHLLDAAAASAQVGVVGPKLVSWEDPTRLVEAGLTVSRGGRRASGVAPDERDQGQHDHRTDVLAVGTAGLLVNRVLWDRLGGLDPALPLMRDDIDLCWRAHLAGRRVVLAPRAVVADAQAATRGLRSTDAVRGPVHRADRRHALHVALARCSWPALPLLLAWLVLGGLVRSVGLLGAKAPRRAADELTATLAVALTPWTWLGSRWRARGTRSVRRRDVSGLLSPRLGFVRQAVERLGGLAAADGAEQTGLVAAEPGPIADEADPVALPPARWPRRVLRHPLTGVLLVVAATTAMSSRALVGGGRLAGGQLLPAQGRPGDLWHAAVDNWAGAGLGGAVTASPGAVVRAAATAALTPLAGDAASARAVQVLLVAAPVLATVSAYVAAGLVTRSRWARAWAALVWASLPVLTGAIDQGRLGPVAACVLLPLVGAAVARSLSRRRDGAWRAVCTASLGLALLGSALPALLVAGLVVAVAGVLLAHGAARARAALLVVLPVALLGPWLGALVGDPRQLLAGPGALVTGSTTEPLAVLADLAPLPPGWPGWAGAAFAAPLVVAGLAGLLRAGRVGRVLLGVWALGLLGLAAALAAPLVTVSRTPDGPLHPFAGTGLLLLAAATLTSAVAGADGLGRRLAAHRFGWRQLVLAPIVVAAVAAPLAASFSWAWPPGPAADPPVLRLESATVPAVAQDGESGPSALRTLVIAGRGQDVTYDLHGREPGPWARGLAQPGDQRVADAVSVLVGPAPSTDRLAALAVGFVVVRSSAPPRVAAALDTLAGLTRLGATRSTSLWRVQQPAGRVTIATGRHLVDVPVTGPHAAVDTRIAASSAVRRLVLAEPASPGWQARLDGRSLAPVSDPAVPWRQAFALPAGGGHLVVGHVDPVRRWWLLGQGALAVALLLLALPGLRRERAGR